MSISYTTYNGRDRLFHLKSVPEREQKQEQQNHANHLLYDTGVKDPIKIYIAANNILTNSLVAADIVIWSRYRLENRLD